MIDFSKLKKQDIFIRIAIIIGAIAIVSIFFPRQGKFSYEYSLGRPWNYSLLTAPFDMPIYIDSVSAAKQKDSIDASFVPIYQHKSSVEHNNILALRNALYADHSISMRTKNLILSHVQHIYNDGIISNDDFQKISSGKLPEIRFINNNEAVTASSSSLLSVRKAFEVLDSIAPSPEFKDALINCNISRFLSPNVILDSIESKRMLDQLYQKALAPIGILQKGERIVDRGEKISPRTFTLLQTYEKLMAERMPKQTDSAYRILGQVSITAILFFSLFAFLISFRARTFLNTRKFVFIFTFIALFIVATFCAISAFSNAIYLIPFATVPLILSTFYDSRTAFFANIIVILLCALISPFPLEFIILQGITGLIAILSTQELSRRSQLIQCAIFIFIAYCTIYVSMAIFKDGSISHINPHVLIYFVFNGIILSFAYVLVFLIEKIFGFVSPVTLVELSDVNNPLLRELSEKCPGTFQHSLQVANLASEAAHSIDANVKLVRAGALYHDIGKIENPAFFTENQRGVNPHLALQPEQSAAIVMNHVKDGIKRAEKAKLPKIIIDFIREHHGKGKAKYFYLEALKRAGNPEDVNSELFSYSGPNPSSKETSILMMADATEAASKSLSDHSDDSIKALVDKIIDSQIADGLFVNSPISFRDIETIKHIFTDRLCTIYHSRVAYPDEQNSSKA